MKRRVAVRAIVVYAGKLLCVKLLPYNGAIRGDFRCLPGGGLDDGEGLVEGITREMIEETGVTPNVGNLLYVQQFATPDTNAEHLEFFFHVTNAEDYLHINLANTTHGQAEIAEVAFVDPAATNILPKFLTTENIPAKIAANDPPTIFNFL